MVGLEFEFGIRALGNEAEAAAGLGRRHRCRHLKIATGRDSKKKQGEGEEPGDMHVN